VFGVAGRVAPLDLAGLLTGMGRSLQHRPWMTARSWTDAKVGIGLGHLGIGLFNAGPQPVWNTERTVALVMAGEVDGLPDDPESIALGLYEQHGLTFAQHLAGAFVIALWDSARQRLVIANDRFGMYDLFFACRAGRLLFSPEVKGILADPSFPRQIDLTALAQYMRFQHLLGDRTFLQDIRLLPPGSILTFDQSTGDLSVNAYWSFADLPNRELIDRAEAAEEVGRLLRLAVRSRSEGPLRPGVFLSGGLDSRTILGLIDRRPVTSITFGAPECRDVHLAARIASIVGSNHHWFDLSDSKWVEEWAPLHLTLTEGQHSWIHSHGISALPAARQWMDVELTGWDGGTVMVPYCQ
jgi:asparagine synthase (glutamine-hydrolysing)